MEHTEFNEYAKSPLEIARHNRDEGKDVNMGEAEWATLTELKKSIEATKDRMKRGDFPDESGLQSHLEGLIEEFKRNAKESIIDTNKRIADHKLNGIDFSYLRWHIENIRTLLLEITGSREIGGI